MSQPSRLTFVDAGDLVLEVDQCRQLFNAVLLGLLVVVDLDEDDAVLVTLVVDVLQLDQRVQVLLVIFVVCRGTHTAFNTTDPRSGDSRLSSVSSDHDNNYFLFPIS